MSLRADSPMGDSTIERSRLRGVHGVKLFVRHSGRLIHRINRRRIIHRLCIYFLQEAHICLCESRLNFLLPYFLRPINAASAGDLP